MKKVSANRQVYQLLIILLSFLIFLLFLDMSNFITTFKSKDVIISLSNINVENWSNFAIGISSTTIAVLGTWYVTDRSATKQIKNEKELRNLEMQRIEEQRHLSNIAGLNIYYFIKNAIEDANYLNDDNDIEDDTILVLAVNTLDINYIKWQRELNILREYIKFKGDDVGMVRPLRFIPFPKEQLSRGIDMYGSQVLCIDFEKLDSVNSTAFDYYIKFPSTSFDKISDKDFNIISKLSALYFKRPIDILKLNEKEFEQLVVGQSQKILKDYDKFKDDLKNLKRLMYNEERRVDEFYKYYNDVGEYILKYNQLELCIAEERIMYKYQLLPEIEKFDLNNTHVVEASALEFLGEDTNIQLVIRVNEFQQLIALVDQNI